MPICCKFSRIGSGSSFRASYVYASDEVWERSPCTVTNPQTLCLLYIPSLDAEWCRGYFRFTYITNYSTEMVASLASKTVVVVGGTSGIGYAVAKASVLSQAAHVVVVGTSQEKAERTVQRLRDDIATETAKAPVGTLPPISGTISSDTLDAHDLASVRAFCERVGEVDHFVWTSGDPLRVGFPQTLSLDENRGGSCSGSAVWMLTLC